MTEYNVEVEFIAKEATDDQIDDLLDSLAAFHPGIGRSIRGRVAATVTVPAPSLQKAVSTALAAAPLPVLSVTGMTTREFDRRGEHVDEHAVPPLLSLPEAAERLGTTRQAVHLRIESGSLPGIRVGRAWVVPAAAVPPRKPDTAA